MGKKWNKKKPDKYGFVNDADYCIARKDPVTKKQVWVCGYFEMWANMKRRVLAKYKADKKRYLTYQDVEVHDDWKLFSKFKSWAENQMKYYGKSIRETGDGFVLDKDILVIGNRIYGPHTCCIVPENINAFFLKSDKTRGKYPIGVIYYAAKKLYVSRCSDRSVIEGNSVYLGCYKTEILAHAAWQEYKANKALSLSADIPHPYVKIALKRVHDQLKFQARIGEITTIF